MPAHAPQHPQWTIASLTREHAEADLDFWVGCDDRGRVGLFLPSLIGAIGVANPPERPLEDADVQACGDALYLWLYDTLAFPFDHIESDKFARAAEARGLFLFHHPDGPFTQPYTRTLLPRSPCLLGALPEDVRAAARPVTLPGAIFAEQDRIQPAEHAPCLVPACGYFRDAADTSDGLEYVPGAHGRERFEQIFGHTNPVSEVAIEALLESLRAEWRLLLLLWMSGATR